MTIESLELGVKLGLVLAVWAILTAPLLFAASRAIRWMRKTGKRSTTAALILSTVITLLVAPIPTPIITVFVPSAFAWITGTTYPHVLAEHIWSEQLLTIALVSHCATLLVTFLVCKHLLAAASGRPADATDPVSRQAD